QLLRNGRLCRFRVAGLCGGGTRDRRHLVAILAALPCQRRPARPGPAPVRPRPMTRKRRRLAYLVLGLGALGGATAMVLAAFNENLVFFYSPSDLVEQHVGPERRIRIGGLVEEHSLARADNGHTVTFRVTDGAKELAVAYDGILPDLFREGQGVVAEGKMRADGVFAASSV